MSQFTPPSNPLATLFHGTVTIEPGCDSTSQSGGLYGFGDMFVSRQVQIGYNSTLPSFNASTGSLVVHGGVGVKENTNLALSLNVLGTTGNATNLRETHIDTTWGVLQVSGGNQISMSVGDSISLASINNSVTLSAGNTIVLESSLNSANAIQILNRNAQGGIVLLTGEASGYQLTTGSGGAVMTTSAGNINLTSNNGSGLFRVNASQGNQNLTFDLSGNTDSGILIQSSGKNTTLDAIAIKTLNSGGNVVISNSGGNSNANIQLLAGSTGIIGTTNTGGPIQLTARDAASYFVVNTSSANKNLTIGVTGATDSSLVLESEGTNSTNAIIIKNMNATGSMLITNVSGGSGGVTTYTGSGGFNVGSLSGGINLNAKGASSSFINQTTSGTGQDLVIGVKGIDSVTSQNNKLILSSESVNAYSIFLNTSGGTYLSSRGEVNIQTLDGTNGINIGTSATVPVKIGTTNSTTTIAGNLDVKGTTTTFDSTIVQIKDNFIVVNSQPQGLNPTLDGGLAIKRYQEVGDGTCGSLKGSVITDTPEFIGTVTSVVTGSSSAVGVSIATTDFNTTSNYYSGYWIKVTYYNGSTTGSPPTEDHSGDICWVRRIKSSVATSGFGTSQQTFTIYNTNDQTSPTNASPPGLGNPIPTEGADYPGSMMTPSSLPVAGGSNVGGRLTFSIYPCHWIVSMWDEQEKEYALICANSIGEYQNIASPQHYINLHVNNIKANVLTVNSINNLTADVQFTIQLIDNSTAPVELNPATSIPTPSQLGYPYPNYGVFIVLVRPKIAVETSPYAVFVIGRRKSSTACGQVARLISVKGINGDMLDMSWLANSYPQIFYRPHSGISSTTDYTLKFIAV